MLLLNENDYTAMKISMDTSMSSKYNAKSQLDELDESRDDRSAERYKFTTPEGLFLVGILDSANVKLVITGIETLGYATDSDEAKRLFKNVVNNLELHHPEIDVAVWEIPKADFMNVEYCLNSGFEVYQAKPYSFIMAYHLGWRTDMSITVVADPIIDSTLSKVDDDVADVYNDYDVMG